MKKHRPALGILLNLLVLGAACVAAAKAPAAAADPVRPGQITERGGAYEIALEQGRSLRWAAGDQVSVLDNSGKNLLTVSLQAAASKESSSEAMGISVEETDLGGSMSSKSYLSGKKKPQGRAFNPSSLADQPTASQADKEQKTTVDGIAITTVDFVNGASLLRFAWPDATEEIYFDRKKTMVHSDNVRKQGGLTVGLKQWAEGSYARRYLRGDAGVTVTYDDNDGSYLFEFFNGKGELLNQLNCRETCTP